MWARAFFMRFGISIQRSCVVRAYDKFLFLWLEHFGQNHIPSVGTLCALVIAHQRLPDKGDVAKAWAEEAREVLGDPLQEWPLPAHDFIDAVHRWGSLRREEAVELILEIETALAAPPELKDNVGEDARAPEKHVEDTLREYAPVPEKQVEGAAADKTSLALKRRAHPKPKTKPKDNVGEDDRVPEKHVEAG
ncbi:Pentatricopeptide repeat-containing protein [Durusdinium trenchii]